jgi:hypothetical protein
LNRKMLYSAMLSLVGGLAGGTLSNLIIAGHGANASSSPRVIEADLIQVVDKLGKPRVILATNDCDETRPDCANEANVILVDHRGKARLDLSSGNQNEGPRVLLFDLDGKRRAQLSLNPSNGEPELSLFDQDLKRRTLLVEGLLIVGNQEKGGAYAGISAEAKEGSLVLLENPRNSSVSLAAYSKQGTIPATASLNLSDGSGKTIAHLP